MRKYKRDKRKELREKDKGGIVHDYKKFSNKKKGDFGVLILFRLFFKNSKGSIFFLYRCIDTDIVFWLYMNRYKCMKKK